MNLSTIDPPRDPKPYKIVGYDPLIEGENPYNRRFLDPQVLVPERHEVIYPVRLASQPPTEPRLHRRKYETQLGLGFRA